MYFMKRYAVILLVAIFTTVVLYSCSKFIPSTEVGEQLQISLISEVESDSGSTDMTMSEQSFYSIVYPDKFDLEFADLADIVFDFSRGVGAWCTQIEILSDGTFSGYHSDQDVGDTDVDYPKGTRYFCSFSGKFLELKK